VVICEKIIDNKKKTW